ncbi:MAG TPA: hypothetical protein VHQ98_11775 [Gaiellaceae bacterium]|jgi:hypothetical protein|nr:hypothetical protein [Gaiellaceae bacterium]
MSRDQLGWVIWGALGVAILIPELLAIRDRRWYWPTVARTAANLEAHLPWLAMIFLAGFAILTVHLVFWPWPDVP